MVNQKILIVTVTCAILIVAAAALSIFAVGNPSGPKVAPLLKNAPQYICPSTMPPALCAQLKITCGNGVQDPGEDCRNCPFDAGCPSSLVCGNLNGGTVYTCHYPAGLCLAGPAG